MKLNPDQKVAEALGRPAEWVRQERLRWNGEKVMRATLTERFRQQITERDTALRTVPTIGLEKLQGEIAGLELGLKMLTRTEI